MAKKKTAVSIDECLLKETDQIAQELDIPRSQVVSLALSDFNQRYRNRQLLSQINEAYADPLDADEVGTQEVIRSHRNKLWKNEEWK
jgi:metal-responsive CopG/Arc/MetJ family transcriptional regulator